MMLVPDDERPAHRPPSRILPFSAHLSAGYPILLLASLYGQWLLSWWVLGHRPLPSLDDPKYKDGASWMHLVTFALLMGLLPAACGALVLNIRYVLKRHLRGVRLLLRIAAVVLLWAGTIVLLSRDPGGVVYWWMD